MRNNEIHVVPRQGNWTVEAVGQQGERQYRTQEEAVDAARDLARREHKELVVHGEDGRIRDKDSYGNDPYPPRG